MSKKIINIICADDEQGIHLGLDRAIDTANKNNELFEFKIIKHFYSTTELASFLETYRKDKIDILLLDIDFKGDESGLEALEYIRYLDPFLNIILLSYHEELSNLITSACKKYDVKFLEKPITSHKLIIHINEVIEQQKKIDHLKSDLKFFVDMLEKEETKIPTEAEEIILKIFRRIKFTKLALQEFIDSTDYRVFECLRRIDQNDITPGMKPTKTWNPVRGYDDVTEYRGSKRIRIFVTGKDVPLVIEIDCNHDEFD